MNDEPQVPPADEIPRPDAPSEDVENARATAPSARDLPPLDAILPAQAVPLP